MRDYSKFVILVWRERERDINKGTLRKSERSREKERIRMRAGERNREVEKREREVKGHYKGIIMRGEREKLVLLRYRGRRRIKMLFLIILLNFVDTSF